MERTYIVHKFIDPMAVRSLCIQRHWYTRGTTQEYEQMLQGLLDEHFMSRDDITDQDIIALAENIVEHSDLEYMDNDPVASIAFEVARLVTCVFEATRDTDIKKERTLKERLREAAAEYTHHAEWEDKKAAQATWGSRIRQEVTEASKYNRGRADAMNEVLSWIEAAMV